MTGKETKTVINSMKKLVKYHEKIWGCDQCVQVINMALKLIDEKLDIILCANCKWHEYDGVDYCRKIHTDVDPAWFCADGERAVCLYMGLHGELPTQDVCKNGCYKCEFNVPPIPEKKE